MANNLGYDPNNPYLVTSVFDPYSGNVNPYRTTSYPEEYPEMAKFMTAPTYTPTKYVGPSFDTTPPPIYYTPQGSTEMQRYFSPYVPMSIQLTGKSGTASSNQSSTTNPYRNASTSTYSYPNQSTYGSNINPYTSSYPTSSGNTSTSSGNYSQAYYGGTPMYNYGNTNYVPSARLGRYDNDTYDYWKQGYNMFSNNALNTDPSIQAIKAYLDAQGQNQYNDALGQMATYTGGSLNSAAAGAASAAKQNANLALAAQLPNILSQQRNDYLNYLNFGGTRGDAEYARFADDRNFASSENQRRFSNNLAYGELTGYVPNGMLDTGATPSSPYGNQTLASVQAEAAIRQQDTLLKQAQQKLEADIALANRVQDEVERAALINEAYTEFNNQSARIQAEAAMKAAEKPAAGTTDYASLYAALLNGGNNNNNGDNNGGVVDDGKKTGPNVDTTVPVKDNTTTGDTQQQPQYDAVVNTRKPNSPKDIKGYYDYVAQHQNLSEADYKSIMLQMVLDGIDQSEITKFAQRYGVDIKKPVYTPPKQKTMPKD